MLIEMDFKIEKVYSGPNLFKPTSKFTHSMTQRVFTFLRHGFRCEFRDRHLYNATTAASACRVVLDKMQRQRATVGIKPGHLPSGACMIPFDRRAAEGMKAVLGYESDKFFLVNFSIFVE